MNVTLDRSGAPACMWFLCLMWVCAITNSLATESLGWKTPLEVLTGNTPDISQMLQFQFYEPVYFASAASLSYAAKPKFPSQSPEERGRFVGFGETVGDAFTYKIITDKTNTIIYRSSVRSALSDTDRNLRADLVSSEGERTPPEILKSPPRRPMTATSFQLSEDTGSDSPDPHTNATTLQPPTEVSDPNKLTFDKNFDPECLVNRTYLTDPDENGQIFRARVVKQLGKAIQRTRLQDDHAKFLVAINNPDNEEKIMEYNELLNMFNKQQDNDDDPDAVFWKFEEILGHQGPLKPGDEGYKGSSYNVMMGWSGGERTYEPLDLIAADNPAVVAEYAKRNGLLDTPGWKRFKRLARRPKVLERAINQAKRRSFRTTPVYMFGYRVPRTPEEAIAIDKENGNNKWQDSMDLELNSLQECVFL